MSLFQKYDRPVPRYTSYPTVPYWQSTAPSEQAWLGAINRRLSASPEISLYVHLPFCERLCTYCGCNKRITNNHAVEGIYIDAVLAELAIYRRTLHPRPRLKELHLGGGTPTFFSPASLARLVDGITQELDVAEQPSFSFEAHPGSTTLEHLRVLAERGFNRISIGVQDFSPAIMRLINRWQTEADVIRTIEDARQSGYQSVNFDLIYGLPRQAIRDVVYTAEKVHDLRPDRIAFYGYAHAPWVSPGQRAYAESDLPRGREKWNLYTIGRSLLEEADYRDIGLDHFAQPGDELYRAHNNGTLHRNFMGYTTASSPVTLALGCSAIGDSWDTYVQNEKQVEAYQYAVLVQGKLPIVRGHQLTDEEQIVRRHILNLMCRGYTDWKDENLQCPALDRAVEQWNEMAVDGIVRRSPYRVEVTAAGRPFLRNICLPLDDHYWEKQPGRVAGSTPLATELEFYDRQIPELTIQNAIDSRR
ncbi:oxygen-independent coproporphyrinogen-3 oxidase [Lewinella aquimaris]|uniref:Coproporphyrinogen-III oxidase n=1 Tax=Neolewinella aquimaris TaxID=1835722 RepID=A0A840EAP8_9BACT|nr:oxygen-independent coproporphyrinogen III oxidase [Neolewinella aquimaris]MBB4079088.1 oxygen-independent coproporphyrinogen-3 oxidase [Neolewinella aquimaris]